MNPGSALLAALAELVRREELRGLRLSGTAAWSSALCLHSTEAGMAKRETKYGVESSLVLLTPE